jgi:hypothetical protein
MNMIKDEESNKPVLPCCGVQKSYAEYFWIHSLSVLAAQTDRSKQHERQAQLQFGKQF